MRFTESTPIYLQIADSLCDGVLTGRYGPGTRVPSVREMAEAIEVNPNTVQRTYATLQEWGIVETRRGQGYFVTDHAPGKARDRRRSRLTDTHIPRLVHLMRVLDMSVDDLAALVRRTMNTRTTAEEAHS